jgi:hypothetical protein
MTSGWWKRLNPFRYKPIGAWIYHGRTRLPFGITQECFDRLKSGEVEVVEVGPKTDVVISFMGAKLPPNTPGVRGEGCYLFTNHESQITGVK